MTPTTTPTPTPTLTSGLPDCPIVVETVEYVECSYNGFTITCDEPSPSNTPTSTPTPTPTSTSGALPECYDYYNDTGMVLTGMSGIYCNGTEFTNISLNPGQSVCVLGNNISGGGTGSLRILGPC
jgi:hypothetical protein